jgi:hypothetical protein
MAPALKAGGRNREDRLASRNALAAAGVRRRTSRRVELVEEAIT